MSIQDDEIRSLGPAPRGSRRPGRSWLMVGLPLAVLLVVVAFAMFGRSAQPPSVVPALAVPITSPSPPGAVDTPDIVEPSPAIAEECVPDRRAFTPGAALDLTGLWAGDDGGIYYVRQLGSVIWWSGMSNRDQPPASLGRDWNNVGRGELGKDLTIVSDWADVPRGGILGSGTVTLKVGPDADGNLQITKRSETGTGRGDTLWTPCVRA